MSKLNIETFKRCLNEVLEESKAKNRKFTESLELQINLKDYDTQRDKRFAGTVRLPHPAKPKMRVCVLGDVQHCEQAKAINLAHIDQEGMKKFNKNKKVIKKFCNKYDNFLASNVIFPQIPRFFGPALNKAGKFPAVMTHQDKLEEKLHDLKCSLKIQLKKETVISFAFAHVDMPFEHVLTNGATSINFLVSLMKKGWNNIKSIHLKSTMGKVKIVY